MNTVLSPLESHAGRLAGGPPPGAGLPPLAAGRTARRAGGWARRGARTVPARRAHIAERAYAAELAHTERVHARAAAGPEVPA